MKRNYEKIKGYIYVGGADVPVYYRNTGTDRYSQLKIYHEGTELRKQL